MRLTTMSKLRHDQYHERLRLVHATLRHTQDLQKAAERLGMQPQSIRVLLWRAGITVEHCFTNPVPRSQTNGL